VLENPPAKSLMTSPVAVFHDGISQPTMFDESGGFSAHCFPQVFFLSTQSSLQSLGRTLVAKDAISMSRHLVAIVTGWVRFFMWDEATDPLESHGKLSMPERHLDLELV